MSTSPQCECDTVIPDIDFWLRRQKMHTYKKKYYTVATHNLIDNLGSV